MAKKSTKATRKTAKETTKGTTVKKTEAKAKITSQTEGSSESTEKTILSRFGVADKKATPIVFSLDDVEALVKTKKEQKKAEEEEDAEIKKVKEEKASAALAPAKRTVVDDKPAEKRVLGAASLADILGFNPAAKKKTANLEEEDIPRKWKKFYDLLIGLRKHVRDELDLHTADTLKHSNREDSGDLASYGNHQADAGTDTFDRDFALSLVSNEQDALNEIEEAIMRIKDGSYGVCEVTGEPINKERLAAVPFARFSVEGQAEYEKNKRRKHERHVAGLFADSADAPKLASDDDE